jgi:hypothetical protein
MFKSYHEARCAAEQAADSDGFDRGIERCTYPSAPWRVFMLPRKENRYGHELRCDPESINGDPAYLVRFDAPARTWWSNQLPSDSFWFPPHELRGVE